MLTDTMKERILYVRLFDLGKELVVCGLSTAQINSLLEVYAKAVCDKHWNDETFTCWCRVVFGQRLAEALLDREMTLNQLIKTVNDYKDEAVRILREHGLKITVV